MQCGKCCERNKVQALWEPGREQTRAVLCCACACVHSETWGGRAKKRRRSGYNFRAQILYLIQIGFFHGHVALLSTHQPRKNYFGTRYKCIMKTDLNDNIIIPTTALKILRNIIFPYGNFTNPFFNTIH